MENKIMIKHIDIFYVREDDAWNADIELESGKLLNFEGEIPQVKVGKKYVQSNFFVVDNISEEIMNAIKEYYYGKEYKMEFISSDEYLAIERQSKLISTNNIVPVSNIEIAEIGIVIKENLPRDLILTLKTGEKFAIDGRLNFKYMEGIVQYANVFVVRDGVYPCDAKGFGIFNREILHNEFVNKGFLTETIEHSGKGSYKLSSSFNKALARAICDYNSKKAMIKIYSGVPEEFSPLSPELIQKFYDADSSDKIITIYSAEQPKLFAKRMDKARLNVCSNEAIIKPGPMEIL